MTKLIIWLVMVAFFMVPTAGYTQNDNTFAKDSYYNLYLTNVEWVEYSYDSYGDAYRSITKAIDVVFGVGYGKRIIDPFNRFDFYGEVNLDVSKKYFIGRLGVILDILFNSLALSFHYQAGLGLDTPNSTDHPEYSDRQWLVQYSAIGFRFSGNKHFRLTLSTYRHYHDGATQEEMGDGGFAVGLARLF